MTAVEMLETGLVYRGTPEDPHFQNAHFPSLAELAGGELVVTMGIGESMRSADVRCFICRSSDGGRSWTRPEKIFEPAAGDPATGVRPTGGPEVSEHPVSTGIRMSRTREGLLIGFVNLLPLVDLEGRLTNPETGGTVERKHGIIRSSDGGKTWSDLHFFEPPVGWKCLGEPSPILPLSRDRWLLPSLTRLNWQGECPLGLKSFVMISEDEGMTWPGSADVFDLWDQRIVTWEQKQTVLTDGRILAVTWAFNDGTKEDLPNLYTFSEDRGGSYLPPMASPLHGQTCAPLALRDNHFLCVYRRLDKRGLWAHLARMEDERWVPLAETCLWGPDVEAIAGGGDSSMVNLGKLQFGFPQLVQLSDGDIFVVFWAVEEGLSVIRRFRLRVDL